MKRIALLLLVVATLATACQTGNVFLLTVGDCFNNPDAVVEVTDVEMVDCGEPHDNEVFAAYEMTQSTYPGQAAAQARADEGCKDRFESFVGTPYLDSSLALGFLTPTEASWDQGDREVICTLFDMNGNQLATSARGTGI